MRLVESEKDEIIFFIQPYFVKEKNATTKVLLKVDIESNNKIMTSFRKFGSVEEVLQKDDVLGLWGINFFGDKNEQLFIFFTIKDVTVKSSR